MTINTLNMTLDNCYILPTNSKVQTRMIHWLVDCLLRVLQWYTVMHLKCNGSNDLTASARKIALREGEWHFEKNLSNINGTFGGNSQNLGRQVEARMELQIQL